MESEVIVEEMTLKTIIILVLFVPVWLAILVSPLYLGRVWRWVYYCWLASDTVKSEYLHACENRHVPEAKVKKVPLRNRIKVFFAKRVETGHRKTCCRMLHGKACWSSLWKCCENDKIAKMDEWRDKRNS